MLDSMASWRCDWYRYCPDTVVFDVTSMMALVRHGFRHGATPRCGRAVWGTELSLPGVGRAMVSFCEIAVTNARATGGADYFVHLASGLRLLGWGPGLPPDRVGQRDDAVFLDRTSVAPGRWQMGPCGFSRISSD